MSDQILDTDYIKIDSSCVFVTDL